MIDHYFHYRPNIALPDEVIKHIEQYIFLNGKDPGRLELGYGTYFELCLAITNLHFYNEMQWLIEFGGIPIALDASQERHISTNSLPLASDLPKSDSRESLKKQAIEAFLKTKRLHPLSKSDRP